MSYTPVSLSDDLVVETDEQMALRLSQELNGGLEGGTGRPRGGTQSADNNDFAGFQIPGVCVCVCIRM
jgi:hypothetical protein